MNWKVAQIAMACPRCRSSRNLLVIKASGRRQGRAGDAQQRTRDDQHQRADREGGHDRQHRERRSADHQQPSAADPVAERTHRDDQAGHHESVAVTDPQLLDVGGTQVGAQPWEREEQRRHVHRRRAMSAA